MSVYHLPCMLAENANCPDCGEVFLRNASADF